MKFHGVDMRGAFTNESKDTPPVWASAEDIGRQVYYNGELYLGDDSKFKKLIDEDNFSSSNILAPVGTILTYAGSVAPNASWKICNGEELDPLLFPVLYALIGTTFGSGVGTFKIPDLRTLFPRGVGTGVALGSTGGASTTDTTHTHNILDHTHAGGAHVHSINHSHSIPGHLHTVASHRHTIPGETLSISEIPSHRHGPSNLLYKQSAGGWGPGAGSQGATTYTDYTGGGNSHNHTGNTGYDNPNTNSVSQNTDALTGNSGAASGNTGGMNQTTGTSSAGNQVSIIPPFLGLNFIIRVQ